MTDFFFLLFLCLMSLHVLSQSTPKQTLRMRVVLLDVSLTWSEFLPLSLIDVPADIEVQVHADSQTRHTLKMVRNTLPECRFYSTSRSSLVILNPCVITQSCSLFVATSMFGTLASISKVKWMKGYIWFSAGSSFSINSWEDSLWIQSNMLVNRYQCINEFPVQCATCGIR